MVGFPLPDPPLSDGWIQLGCWRVDEADVLASAWAEPEVRRWTAVPADPTVAYARRWIAGEAKRRDHGLALDLVIRSTGSPERVMGEVGVVPAGAGRVEIGYWVMATDRGGGVASAAVALFADWLLAIGVDEIVAEVDPANPGSSRVAAKARFFAVAENPNRMVRVRQLAHG